MPPSTPSADPDEELGQDADVAFRTRRIARLRRGRRRFGVAGWAAVAVVAVVAVVITVHRSQPDDHVRTEALSPKIRDAAAPRQGATGCVGWPLSLTPSVKPAAREGAVTLWGDRSAFHFRNVTGGKVIIDVTSTGGALRPVEQDGTQVGDDHLHFEIAPDGEARFTAACSVTALSFAGSLASGAALGKGAFELGTGAADAPLEITKAVR